MKMTQEELNVILSDHVKWLEDSIKGKRADLRKSDLRGADLREAIYNLEKSLGIITE